MRCQARKTPAFTMVTKAPIERSGTCSLQMVQDDLFKLLYLFNYFYFGQVGRERACCGSSAVNDNSDLRPTGNFSRAQVSLDEGTSTNCAHLFPVESDKMLFMRSFHLMDVW